MFSGIMAALILIFWAWLGYRVYKKLSKDYIKAKLSTIGDPYPFDEAYYAKRAESDFRSIYTSVFGILSLLFLLAAIFQLSSCGTVGDILLTWGMIVLVAIVTFGTAIILVLFADFVFVKVIPWLKNKAWTHTPDAVKKNVKKVKSSLKNESIYFKIMLGLVALALLFGFGAIGQMQSPLCEQEESVVEVVEPSDIEKINTVLLEHSPELVDEFEMLLANQQEE